jgi:hypothetical protein
MELDDCSSILCSSLTIEYMQEARVKAAARRTASFSGSLHTPRVSDDTNFTKRIQSCINHSETLMTEATMALNSPVSPKLLMEGIYVAERTRLPVSQVNTQSAERMMVMTEGRSLETVALLEKQIANDGLRQPSEQPFARTVGTCCNRCTNTNRSQIYPVQSGVKADPKIMTELLGGISFDNGVSDLSYILDKIE